MKYVLRSHHGKWLTDGDCFTDLLQRAKLFETEIGANRVKTKHERKHEDSTVDVIEVTINIQLRGDHQ